MKVAIALIFLLASAVAFADGAAAPAIAQTQAQDNFATRRLSSDELAGLLGQPNLYLIDVRTAEEFKAGAIPSAVNIPYDVIEKQLPTQERSARIVVYCRSGNRSSIAKSKLEALGFTNVSNFGPVSNWKGKLIVR